MPTNQDLNFILGIDIGSTKVCAIITRPVHKNGKESLEVIGLGKAKCEGVSKGSINNLHRTSDAVRNALETATQQAGFSFDDLPKLLANVNVGGMHIHTKNGFNTITRKTHGEDVKTEDISRLFNEVLTGTNIPDGSEVVHVLPQNFIVDEETNIYDPIGQIGRKLSGDFHLITGRKMMLNHIKTTLSSAHRILEDDQMIVSPLASSLSVLDDNQKKMGVAVVDIGGGTTDLAIYHKGALRHISILPFAGIQITTDIEEGCRLSSESAEKAKKVLGNTNPNDCLDTMLMEVPNVGGVPPQIIVAKNVAYIMEARLREIAAMVYNEIKQAGFDHKLHAGIVLTGGSALIKNIDKVFASVTNMHVQVGSHKGLETTGLYKEVIADPSCATALGLAWSSLKPLDSRLDVHIKTAGYDRNDAPKEQQPEKKSSWLSGIKSKFGDLISDRLDDEYTL